MIGATTATHLPGFSAPVHDAQRTFRAVLQAMARPTLPQDVDPVREGRLRTPAPLGAVAGAVLLTLCDEQTPIWLDRALAASEDVREWIRFHTGARLVASSGDALFAVASSPSAAPRLADLAQGTDEEPHLSATLVIDATGTAPVGAFVATGPGVDGSVAWDGSGLPRVHGEDGFLAQWRRNRVGFPRGVDVVLAAETTVRALPRTTELSEGSA
ncbi:phosphonate C-P lyase system protein PhnH [Microbacterium marinilacus]|uniref:Phosphonate C-P lyase system protein PhnH n=1 Tax=Microbacterium marinilacus TaxID=415209 RepID=A0ABP7B5Z7_9MICO|nr:phosphonate C-P lyase system protein PhnH [Microbacterium marinilacus]MBY0687751.1 phosphonate C-P lyase system protein PhnH [Microbacterium marinilacus]